jgi:hypothetical protein
MKLALAFVFALATTQVAHAAERLMPPLVPTTIDVPAGVRPFLKGHAIGTQNYICAPAATEYGWDWYFIGPQATVFGPDGLQIMTHFQSMNPDKNNAIHATWQHSRDTSAVWATRRAGSLDSAYVAPNSIEWLLLDVTGQELGPTYGDKLASATIIQRDNTFGGVKPPTTDCTPSIVNQRRLVPYEADYYFY